MHDHDSFPNDTLIGIFSYLDYFSLSKVAAVCELWRELAFSHVENIEYNTYKKYTVGTTNALALQTNKTSSTSFHPFYQYPVTHLVTHISNHCYRLKSLSLVGCNDIHPDMLSAISTLPRLKRLDLSNSRITGHENACYEGLKVLFTQCTHLNWLSLSDLQNRLSEAAVINYIPNMVNLTYLDVTSCYTIDDNCIQSISKIKNLKELNINKCFKISDRGMSFICDGLPKLESLMMANVNTNITSDFFDQLNKMKGLKKFDTSNTRMDFEVYQNLKHLEKLIEFSCKSTRINSEGIGMLCSDITRLDIMSCPNVDDSCMSIIGSMVELKELNISHCTNVTQVGVRDFLIPSPQRLVLLNLSGCRSISSEGLALLAKSDKLTKIKKLMMSCTHCYNNVLLAFSDPECPIQALREFVCNYAVDRYNLGDEGLIPFIKKHNKLTKLMLSGAMAITTQSIKCMSEYLTELYILNLCECTTLMNEEELVQSGDRYSLSSLKYLQLSQSNVGDQLLNGWVAGHSSLVTLDISYCIKITDEGISMFCGKLPEHLRELDLSSNYRITEKALVLIPKRVYVTEPYTV
ncbi:F-box/LRR-repeat protein [Acrasis kona]|uniref:F-box/LRR-repeat protein n=1 Tax=Acrasis kona TaxID=1008807 RepID=A0AAW2ZDE9_9EUKA